jgi:uncharacterized protein DUF3108
MNLCVRLRSVAVAAVVLFVWATPLRAGPLAGPIELHYDVYGSGLRLLSLTLVVEEGTAVYRMAATLRTRGIADVFSSMTMHAEAEGLLVDGVPTPTRYQSDNSLRGREHHLSIEFRPWQAPVVAIDPPDTEERTPIPPGQLLGAVDTFTGVLQMSRTLARGGGCARRIPIFDGTRRFDLVLTDLGTRELKHSDYTFYEGPARLCRVRQERIGGFLVRDADEKNRAQEGQAWIAAVLPDTPPVPVRIEFNSGWGRSILHLVEIRSPTGHRRVN